MDQETIYRALGDKIRRFRKGLGRTQAQIAVETGISRASIANIEAGRQQVLVHHLYAIATALQLDSPEPLLLSAAKAVAPRSISPAALPLPEEGLTEKQRREVLRLMGDTSQNNNANKREDK